MLDLWYKNAVFYCLDVETFMDSDGDGIGDFQGLGDRLDHIEALGATCIWLMPFYPSPNRDNGYDITDFYSVDPRHGSLGDFVNFTRAARDRGLRVIIDLVVNHVSVDHPWFQHARSDPNSPFRDWFVWSKEKPANIHDGVVFPGVQEAIWSYDRKASAWYLHRFYEFQADLNIANPEVREEIDKIMGFWLELGVTGFRIDAVPFLIEYLGVPEKERRGDPHRYLNHLHEFLAWRKAESVLLAEANITLDEVDEYFGDNDRMNLVFNFMLNQHLFLSLARGDAEPMRKVLWTTPKIPDQGQWATFLRNHDELDLGRLSAEERQECFAAFGPDKSMQLYDRGIRRRLAPMLGGDPARLRLAHSLMFALPGSPVIWAGDEIGMGDDLSLEERSAVRTPIQWSAEANAGFSSAPPDKLVRPVVRDGPFGYRKVNIAAQREVDGSLLEHVQRLVRVRRAAPEVGWGEWQVLDTGETSVIGLSYRWRRGEIVTLHNLAGRKARPIVRLDGGDGASLVPLYGDDPERKPCRAGDRVELAPFGFAWFRVDGERR